MPAFKAFIRYPQNETGRDFCVGDLHGMYDLLDKLLLAVKFDKTHDRLFSVGDLIDRGTDSAKALIYLNQPWFIAIRGNHEQLLIDCHENPNDLNTLAIWRENGGRWWDAQPTSLRNAIYRRVKLLPVSLEVETRRGLVGIVHADVPDQWSWAQFTTAVEAGKPEVITHALWSRKRIKNLGDSEKIEGVTDIYCGHTIVERPVSAGNIHFIDTGAYLGRKGKLTLVDLQQGPDYRYNLSESR